MERRKTARLRGFWGVRRRADQRCAGFGGAFVTNAGAAPDTPLAPAEVLPPGRGGPTAGEGAGAVEGIGAGQVVGVPASAGLP